MKEFSMCQKTTIFFRAGFMLAVCAAMAGIISAGQTPTFRVVYSMTGGYDQPGGLIEGSPGVFYSIAGSGPGIVFSVTSQGVQTILASFPTASFQSLLVSGPDRRFYSSLYWGAGNPIYDVFSVSSAANSKRVYSAQNIDPALTQNLPDGRLLGVGVGPSAGTAWDVFESDVDGNVTWIVQFPSTDRTENVIYASDGNFYGVAEALNASTGYLFRLTPSGSSTILYNFPAGTFTAYLPTPLLQADDGNLYGATTSGGANGTGMIYKLTLSGQFTLLHSFEKGSIPHGPISLIEASDGNLYGVAQNDSLVGQIFRITKSGGYEVVYQMSGAEGNPPCWLVQGSDGIIYGIAHAGGSTGEGAVFALDAGLHKPKPTAQQFQPKSGAVGTEVRIWGYNLLLASVTFNGVAATTVSNSGSNYILATVPTGATSGPVTVTTPGGTTTTRASFTVR